MCGYKKDFSFVLPLEKSYRDGDGYYHLAFSLSTSDEDLAGDIITENALNMMVEEAKHININANHEHGLKDIIGSVVDIWKETKNNTVYLWVDVRVRKQWTQIIEDLIESGTRLGGSIEGSITETIRKDGESLINGIKLYGGALTDIPANWTTRGTVKKVSNGCPGSLCTQITKTYTRGVKIEEKKKIRNDVISHAKSLIEKQSVDKGEWDDSTANLEDYKELAAVIDTEADPETETAYSYLLGKNGKVNTKAVSSALSYANGGRGTLKYPELASQIQKLSEVLEKMKNPDKKDEDTEKKMTQILTKFKEELENKFKTKNTTINNSNNNKILKRLETLEEEKEILKLRNKSLENENQTLKLERKQIEYEKLVEKAISLNKKLDSKTKITDESDLMKELKKEFETDTPEKFIPNYIKSLEIILKKLPKGHIPEIYDTTLEKQKNRDKKKITELNKRIAQMGQKIKGE